MSLVLLAAGRGSRMHALTTHRPKALLRIADGRSILAANIEGMRAILPDAKVVVVAGYRHEQIDAFVRDAGRPDALTVAFNSDFGHRGPLRSVQIGLQAISPDCVMVAIANGDTLFRPEALGTLVQPDEGLGLLISADRAPAADDMKVKLASSSLVADASKSIRPKGLISAGLLFACGAMALARLRQAVEDAIREEDRCAQPLCWHSIVRGLHAAGSGARPVLIARDTWQEFDTEACLRRSVQA